MADLRDFTGKNRKFTGTDSITLPTGTTGQRVDGSGKLRFNSSNNLMEYYTGSEWKAVDAPPIINTIAVDGGSAVASTFIDRTTGGNVSILIAGSLFDTSNATVLLVATSGSNITPASTTIDNSSQITIVLPYSDFVDANEPYSVKVTNPSGLSATLADAIYNDTVPTFTNAADTTYGIFDSNRSSLTISAADLCGATDAESDALTYSITSGSLPAGLSIASATGVITGSVSAVSSNTTSTFTVTVAQAGGGPSNSRQFKILVYAPQVDTFTSSGTFTVPTGLTAVDALVVAGGGGSAFHHDGGGGAGGLVYRPGLPITPGSPISVTVGNGGIGGPSGQSRGGDSVFHTLTGKGGGSGSPGDSPPTQEGGSGAGGYHGTTGRPGRPGIQPAQPGDSGTYGFGNPGGNGFYTSPPTGAQGGGGGGAGAAGNNGGPNTPGNGGAGKQYAISGSNVYYAGGGSGGGHQNAGGGSGGVGGGGNTGSGPGAVGNNGTANRGGGAGGGNDSSPTANRTGGSGIVIVTY
jgi:hypothetical protein